MQSNQQIMNQRAQMASDYQSRVRHEHKQQLLE